MALVRRHACAGRTTSAVVLRQQHVRSRWSQHVSASSRDLQVLKGAELEFYWGTQPQALRQEAPHSRVTRILREAEHPVDLIKCVDAQPSFRPVDIATALLRLAGWQADGLLNPDALFAQSVAKLVALAQPQLAAFTPAELSTTMWSVASLDLPQGECAPLAVAVAEQMMVDRAVASLSNQDLVSLVWSLGVLLPTEPPAAVSSFLDAASCHLASQLAGGAELGPEDLADLMWGLAKLRTNGDSPGVVQLLQAVAQLVERQLSNRHSLHATFKPADLAKFVQGYADMHFYDGTTARMLDAVAGQVVKRIRARHVSALSRPSDMVQLLRAYKFLGHNSVVVPELLTAVAYQLRLELAAGGFGLVDPLPQQEISGVAGPTSALDVLCCFQAMGYYPGDTVLTALLTKVPAQLRLTKPVHVIRLLQLLANFQHHPGDSTLTVLCSHLELSQEKLFLDDLLLWISSCAILNHRPPAIALQCLVAKLEGRLLTAGPQLSATPAAMDPTVRDADQPLVGSDVTAKESMPVARRQGEAILDSTVNSTPSLNLSPVMSGLANPVPLGDAASQPLSQRQCCMAIMSLAVFGQLQRPLLHALLHHMAPHGPCVVAEAAAQQQLVLAAAAACGNDGVFAMCQCLGLIPGWPSRLLEQSLERGNSCNAAGTQHRTGWGAVGGSHDHDSWKDQQGMVSGSYGEGQTSHKAAAELGGRSTLEIDPSHRPVVLSASSCQLQAQQALRTTLRAARVEYTTRMPLGSCVLLDGLTVNVHDTPFLVLGPDLCFVNAPQRPTGYASLSHAVMGCETFVVPSITAKQLLVGVCGN